MKTSETSIVKKFLTMPIVENEFTIKVQNLNFTFYADTLLIHNPNQHSIMITYCNGELEINFVTIAVIENVEDFINSDDASLIAKYGRNITNEYILNSLRIDNKSPIDATTDVFKEYFNLKVNGDDK